jgi:hypothetical protein
MPTSRPSLTITETDELADTLAAAGARWPEIRSQREPLLRLVEQGREMLDRERAETTLKMPDCCVLLAAEDAQANAVLTFDDRLAWIHR